MSGLCGGRDLASRLAENLERPNRRVLMQSACEEGGLVEPFDKTLRIARREQHVEEERRVSLGQFSHRPFRPPAGLPGGG